MKTKSHSWVAPLTKWYRRQARSLPWRESFDPYRIWISEVMLQQTQVTTVIPYYQTFMAAFPTVRALAEAPLEAVYARWAGLGYYSRARNLHRGAQTLRDRFQSKFPQDRETILEIPGVGPYTAGAVLSIAFDLPVPLVDGNVERVYSRLFYLDQDIKSREIQKTLWEIATTSVKQADSPRHFNQAVMELGALVCTKGKPKCHLCPISTHCVAFKKGDPERLPVKAKRKAPVSLYWLPLAFEHQGKWLLKKNGEKTWWHGLWDFPHLQAENEKELEASQVRLKKQYAKSQEIYELPERKHTVTHHKIFARPTVIRLKKLPKALPEGDWFSPQELSKLPLSAPAQRLLDDVLQ